MGPLACGDPQFQRVPVPPSPPADAFIGNTATYYRDLVPRLDACMGCHGPGGQPPSMSSYFEVRDMATSTVMTALDAHIESVSAGHACELNDPPSWRGNGDILQALISAWLDEGAPTGSPGERDEPFAEPEQSPVGLPLSASWDIPADAGVWCVPVVNPTPQPIVVVSYAVEASPTIRWGIVHEVSSAFDVDATAGPFACDDDHWITGRPVALAYRAGQTVYRRSDHGTRVGAGALWVLRVAVAESTSEKRLSVTADTVGVWSSSGVIAPVTALVTQAMAEADAAGPMWSVSSRAVGQERLLTGVVARDAVTVYNQGRCALNVAPGPAGISIARWPNDRTPLNVAGPLDGACETPFCRVYARQQWPGALDGRALACDNDCRESCAGDPTCLVTCAAQEGHECAACVIEATLSCRRSGCGLSRDALAVCALSCADRGASLTFCLDAECATPYADFAACDGTLCDEAINACWVR